MSGAVLGLSKEEVDERFDDIAAFADIGEFIDQPVKTYSSGMFVRLAFAVNIVSEPEIMVVDEALAVGDMNFQAKCITALTRMQERGATVLFVSHDIGVLKSLCARGVHLERGMVRSMGSAPHVADYYLRLMREELNAETRRFTRVPTGFEGQSKQLAEDNEPTSAGLHPEPRRSQEFDRRVAASRYGSGGARITYVELLNMSSRPHHAGRLSTRKVRISNPRRINVTQHISVNFNIRDDKKVSLSACGFSQVDQALLATTSARAL